MMIGFDPGDWQLDVLAERLAGLLGMKQHAYPWDNGSFQVGDGNDYWLHPSVKRGLECLWELHARYSRPRRGRRSRCPLLPLDPEHAWMEAHRAELARYRGKHVAVHATRGVVAVGDTIEDVWDEAERQGLSGEVLLSIVPLYG